MPELQSWGPVLNLLESDQRHVALEEIYEVLQEASGDVRAEFFEVFGDELATGAFLSHDRLAFTKLLEPFRQARNTAGLRWVLGHLSKAGEQALGAPAKENLRVFKSQLRDELDAPIDDEAHAVLKSIAEALDVPPSKPRSKKTQG